MVKSERAKRGVTRRGFLATTAVGLGAATALGMPKMKALAEDTGSSLGEEKVVKGRCMFGGCFNCERDVVIRDGYVVSTRPSTEATAFGRRPCARGYNHTMQCYSPKGLQYPMRRVEGTARGEEQWERISWDDAIALVIDKFGSALKEFGSQSVLYA